MFLWAADFHRFGMRFVSLSCQSQHVHQCRALHALHKAVRACMKRFHDVVCQPLALRCPHLPVVQSSMVPITSMEAALSAQAD